MSPRNVTLANLWRFVIYTMHYGPCDKHAPVTVYWYTPRVALGFVLVDVVAYSQSDV